MSPRQVNHFYGESLRLAREYRGLTKKAVAERASCTTAIVARTETGSQPSQLLREAFAEAVDFPLDFLESLPPQVPSLDRLHFRSGASVSKREQLSASARGALLSRLVDVIDEVLNLPVPNVPAVPVESIEQVESAAEECRRRWGISLNAPLKNVTRTLEAAGVIAGSFHVDQRVSGFSWSHGPRPLVMANIQAPTSRRRLTLAHELGHLVMHQAKASGEEELELQAFRFAGAFLVPRRAFIREFPRPNKRFDWRALVAFKERWGLAVQASIVRARRLGLINAAQQRQAFIAISRMGWRKSEPGETSEPEVPRLLLGALNVCRRDLDIGNETIASRARISLAALSELLAEELEPEADPPNVLRLSFGR